MSYGALRIAFLVKGLHGVSSYQIPMPCRVIQSEQNSTSHAWPQCRAVPKPSGFFCGALGLDVGEGEREDGPAYHREHR